MDTSLRQIVKKEIIDVLISHSDRSNKWEQLKTIVEEKGDVACIEIISVISNLEFDINTASELWKGIVAHKDKLEEALGRVVGVDLVAHDYLVNIKPVLYSPKIVDIKNFERISRSAVTDGMTGLFNSDFFRKTLAIEMERAKRYNFSLTLAFFDLDKFKSLNDVYGHLVGDKALIHFAVIMRSSARNVDYAARYGGEEFALILPETDKKGGLVVAERVRSRTEKSVLELDDGQPVKFTVSGGVATYPQDAQAPEKLVDYADKALYTAKRNGRNQISDSYVVQRKFERVESSATVSYKVLGRESSQETVIKNIGMGGILFECGEALPISTIVELDFEGMNEKLKLYSKVVRIEVKENNLYDIGVSFTEISERESKKLENYFSLF